ncbi:MFS transporter [Streptomyces orinoci]|uniref:MFS transporter n=1 Tax=Streptomyces orinoci TaxID=67339 RepID=A0ABV3K082_STRON|nr:MFS transporter [Streptomyces orinoci]
MSGSDAEFGSAASADDRLDGKKMSEAQGRPSHLDEQPEGRAPAGPRPRIGRPFWLLWTAATLSTLGDGIRYVAFPLLAARVTRDPEAVSLVFVAGYLPWPLFGLPAGAVADRVDRRRLMWTVDLARGVLTGGFAFLLTLQDAPVAALAAVSFSLGVAETFFENAAGAIIPMLVQKEALERANAWLYSAQTVMATLVGAPVGAALFGLAHAAPVAADAASFLVATALIFALRGSFGVRAKAAPTTVRQDIAEGLRWLWRHRLLRTLCAMVAVTNGTLAAAEAVLVLYALQVLHLGGIGYGLMLAALAGGGILGSALAPRARRRLGVRIPLIGSMVAQAAGFICAGLTSSVPVAVGVLALVGAGGAVWNVLAASLRQRLVPADMLGRVTSSYRTVALAAMPVGAALAGVLADAFGLHAPFLLSGVLLALATAVAWPWVRSPRLAEE